MDIQKFSNFVTEARKRKGLTQLELAKELYVTDKAVSRWERGIGLPDLKLIQPLAQALDVSIIELMNGEYISASDSPDVQAYEAALRSYDTTRAALKIEKLQRRLERWCLFGLINAVALLYISFYAFFNDYFLLDYFVVYLPSLSQILALLLAVFTIVRACRRKKFTLLLLFTLFCLFWPVIQPALFILFSITISAITPL